MRKLIALCLCLLLMGTACAEQYTVNVYGHDEGAPDCSLLIRDDGTLLTPVGRYSSIYEITPSDTPAAERVYIAWISEEGESGGHAALMNADGELLTGFEFWTLEYMAGADQIGYSRPDGRVGCMDRRGNVLVEGEYFNLLPTGEGGWLALSAGDGDGEILILDADGNAASTGYHTDYFSGNYREGLCPVPGVREFGGECVYLDAKGRLAFEQTFYDAYDFCGLLAPAADANGRFGLIDRSGAFAAAPQYEDVSQSRTGTFLCRASDRVDLYDCQTGALTASIPIGEDEYCWEGANGLLCVNGDSGSKAYDLSGRLLVEVPGGEVDCAYGECDAQPQRLTVTVGDWPETESRLVDLSGNPVGEPFQSFSSALWKENQGRYVFSSFSVKQGADGYPTVNWRDWRYGLCDENGRVLLKPLYSELSPLSLNLCWGRLGSRAGLIDTDGNWLYTLNDYEYLMD